VRLEVLGKLKNPPHPVLELATFRLVAQCFNQLRYRTQQMKFEAISYGVYSNQACKKINTNRNKNWRHNSFQTLSRNFLNVY
jgi:hypothetical protein